MKKSFLPVLLCAVSSTMAWANNAAENSALSLGFGSSFISAKRIRLTATPAYETGIPGLPTAIWKSEAFGAGSLRCHFEGQPVSVFQNPMTIEKRTSLEITSALFDYTRGVWVFDVLANSTKYQPFEILCVNKSSPSDEAARLSIQDVEQALGGNLEIQSAGPCSIKPSDAAKAMSSLFYTSNPYDNGTHAYKLPSPSDEQCNQVLEYIEPGRGWTERFVLIKDQN